MDAIKDKNILLRGGEIIDPFSGKREQQDIVITHGKIDTISKIDDNFSGDIHDVSGYLITPGLLDMHVHMREPGREDEETIESGCAAAMAGGFTAVCPMPNTMPPCDNQEVVRFLKKRSEQLLVDLYPVATITKGRKGEEITEMADLIHAGAVAFSDDGSPVLNTQVMRYAMEYASMYKAPIIDHSEDSFLSAGGHMNESIMSTRLGIQGIPNASEAVMIARNIELARLTQAHVHIAHLSTKEGVALIRRAKEEGISISCEVTPHHLFFTDEDLIEFDTNLKMNPPLRTADDVEALKQGLRDGTIDVFASDHAPHAIQEKDVEFSAAPFGILGLETMLGALLEKVVNSNILEIDRMIAKLSTVPRSILNLSPVEIKKGELANLTIFNPNQKFKVDANKLHSLSRNTPFDGMELPGKVYGVINNNYAQWNKSS